MLPSPTAILLTPRRSAWQPDPAAAKSAAGLGLPNTYGAPSAHPRSRRFFCARNKWARTLASSWRAVRGEPKGSPVRRPVVQPAHRSPPAIGLVVADSITYGDPTMNRSTPAADQARYALSRHVPDMARGFILYTSFGELRVTADEVCRHPALVHAIESILRSRLGGSASVFDPEEEVAVVARSLANDAGLRDVERDDPRLRRLAALLRRDGRAVHAKQNAATAAGGTP